MPNFGFMRSSNNDAASVNKGKFSVVGLVLITFLASVQYGAFEYLPGKVSAFSFICITNAIGFLLLAVCRMKKLCTIPKETWKKGFLFALILTGVNLFMVRGARGTEPIVSASVLSMYFIFVAPLLLLIRKKANFLPLIASVIAVIALLLLFKVDINKILGSDKVLYLLISDAFFAIYVLLVSFKGKNEDPVQFTMVQMFYSALIGLAGWIAQSIYGTARFAVPMSRNFWIAALFVGVFIRVIYGMLQISCQKNVPAITASLIYSSEVVMTLVLEIIADYVLKIRPRPISRYQIAGCILFVAATLLADERVGAKLGYADKDIMRSDENGGVRKGSSVSKKMIIKTLNIAMLTVLICLGVSLGAIKVIRDSSVDNSTRLGREAASSGAAALKSSLEVNLSRTAADKAMLAEAKLSVYEDAVAYAADYASALIRDTEFYQKREILPPDPANEGKWTMQRSLASPEFSYDELREQCCTLGNLEPIFGTIVENLDNVASIYIATESGLMLSYDVFSGDAEPGAEEDYYEYRDSDWYELSKNVTKTGFTSACQEIFDRGLTVTCVAPICDAYGNYFGCAAIDIVIDELNKILVNDGISGVKDALMFDNEGNVIAGKDIDPSSKTTYNIFSQDYHGILKGIGRDMVENRKGLIIANQPQGSIYVAYSSIETTNWTLAILSPVSDIVKPVNKIRSSIDKTTKNVISSVADSVFCMVADCLILAAVLILCVTLYIGRFARKITKPLKELEQDVLTIRHGDFTRHTKVQTDDEIGSLANSFNLMTDSIHQYMTDLKEATAREERIASELSVAAAIQSQMLPSEFDTFSGRKDFELYAVMTPAKEVGGDFYDFFMVDDSHLALVIGDVAGKGVPAALFMVIAKTLIKNRTLLGGTPAEIFGDVNNRLCEGNDANVFVTAWMGIIDLDTGHGYMVNAGHEHPAIRHKGGDFELFRSKHSPALAVMEDLTFRDEEISIGKGDTIFVYTDGVPEATDAAERMYGIERMTEMLNRYKDDSIRTMLQGIRNDVDLFTGDNPAFDDVTMLCMSYGEIEN